MKSKRREEVKGTCSNEKGRDQVEVFLFLGKTSVFVFVVWVTIQKEKRENL